MDTTFSNSSPLVDAIEHCNAKLPHTRTVPFQRPSQNRQKATSKTQDSKIKSISKIFKSKKQAGLKTRLANKKANLTRYRAGKESKSRNQAGVQVGRIR